MNHHYLDARAATASQPELQLMMLEGAIRFGRGARQLWDDQAQGSEVDRLVRRAMDVVVELVRSVTLGGLPISKRLDEEYAFIFRLLAAAQLKHDVSQLDSALKLLDFQRETWRLACDQFRRQATAAPSPQLNESQLSAPGFSFQA